MNRKDRKKQKKNRCCPTCRLVQPPADKCLDCGEDVPVFLQEFDGKFYAKQDRSKNRFKRGFKLALGRVLLFVLVACWMAGAWFAMDRLGVNRRSPFHIWLVWIVGVGGVPAVLALVFRSVFRRFGIPLSRESDDAKEAATRPATRTPRLIKLPRHFSESRGTTYAGKATGSKERVSSFLQERECLAAFLTIGHQTDGMIFLRGVRKVDFLVAQESGDTIVVTGNMWVVRTSECVELTATNAFKGFQALGLDPSRFSQTLEAQPGPGSTAEVILREGDEVEVTGHATQEAMADHAEGYRAARFTAVLHGTHQDPVLICIK